MASLTDRLRIEVDVETVGTGLYGDGNYGDSTYGGGGTAVTDIACVVTAASVDRGRSEGLQRPDVGRCTVTAVGWHPPYVSGWENLLGQPFRLYGKKVDSTWAVIFTGTVEDATFTMQGDGSGSPQDAWTIVAADGLSVLNIVTPSAEADWVNYAPPVQSAYERVALLCSIFTNLTTRSLTSYGSSGTQVQSRTIPGSLLEECGLACDSTAQIIYVDRAGVVVLDEETPQEGPFDGVDPPLGTRLRLYVSDGFGTPPVSGWLNLGCPESAVVRFASGSIRNFCVDQNVGGTRHEYENAGSVAQYGRRSYARTDLIGTGTSVIAPSVANAWLDRYHDPQALLSEVQVHLPSTDSVVDPIDLATQLDVVALLAVHLPPDDHGHRWGSRGRTLGHRWSFTPDLATLTLFAESICTEVP